MNYYQYFPEVDYWFSQAINDNLELNEYRINMPETFTLPDNNYYENGSFIELLFRDVFPYDSYSYTFTEYTTRVLPAKITDRLISKNTQCKIYLSDSLYGTSDAYPLTDTELSLLDELLKYKNGITPDLSTIDSSSGLDTKLSYYMYYFIDTMINREYEWLDNINDINDLYPNATFLENLYEVYILNKIHNEIKQWTFLLNSKSLHQYPIRQRITLTDIHIMDSRLILEAPTPYTTDKMRIYINGEEYELSSFDIVIEEDETVISWDNDILKLKIGDIFMLDYYAAINTYEHQTATEPDITIKGEI